MKSHYDYLVEAGIPIERKDFVFLNESQKINVTDANLTEMFKFIAEKYNSIDFSEIEKSNGDYRIFKYNKLIDDNLNILESIYNTQEVKTYKAYLDDMRTIRNFLTNRADDISYLYKKDRAIIQMTYISLVASLIYGVSELITATIRFVSMDESSEVTVVVENLVNTSRYIHLRNVSKGAELVKSGEFRTLVDEMMKNEKAGFKSKMDPTTGAVNESVTITVSAALLGLLAVPVLAIVLLKITPLIREIIYSIYHSRVKITDALDLQISLLNTNIEALQDKKFDKKVIVRQKKIATALQLIKDKVQMKFDSAEPTTKMVIRKENEKLHVSTDKQDSGLLL